MATENTFIVPPGRGYLWQQQKSKETDPDFKGDIVLQKDYKAGDKLNMRAYMSKAKNFTNRKVIRKNGLRKG